MKKILIIEDDKFIASAYEFKFAKTNFDVRIAFDDKQAYAFLEHFFPEVIMLDLILPRKDGFTVLKELKSHPLYGKIPVIVTSNLGQKNDRDTVIALGAEEYIIKSDISLDSLIQKIRGVITRTT